MNSRNLLNRQKIVRETWLKDYLMDYRFYVGKGNIEVLDDVIELDCEDDYANLHIKQGLALKYALDNFEFDYVFNCDDNTYVVVDRLLSSGYENYDYMGFPCELGNVKYAQGASGYFISKRAIEAFASVSIDSPIYKMPNTPSDFLVGAILASKGIFLQANPLFNMGKYITDEKGTVGYPNVLPTLENKYISAHYCDENTMYKLYNYFHGGKENIVNSYLIKSEKTGVLYKTYEENGLFYIASSERVFGPFDSALCAEEAAIKFETPC
jgi:hypothetical protein